MRRTCDHVFCDNRSARGIAKYRVIETFPNGKQWIDYICAEHLPILLNAWRDKEGFTVEELDPADVPGFFPDPIPAPPF